MVFFMSPFVHMGDSGNFTQVCLFLAPSDKCRICTEKLLVDIASYTKPLFNVAAVGFPICLNALLQGYKISPKDAHTHTQPFNGLLSRTTQVSRYQKGKTNLDFTAARDSEWQWHPLSPMQVCTSLQTDNRASTPPLSFLQAGCADAVPMLNCVSLFVISDWQVLKLVVRRCTLRCHHCRATTVSSA